MQNWLFKSEPDAFSWQDLVARGPKGEAWDGVRNYQARNNMRAMQVGDLGLPLERGQGGRRDLPRHRAHTSRGQRHDRQVGMRANEWAHRRQLALENHFSQLGWKDHLDSVRIYRSKIRQSTDGGGVTYEPMLKNPLRLTDWTAMAMGHIARSWYYRQMGSQHWTRNSWRSPQPKLDSKIERITGSIRGPFKNL